MLQEREKVAHRDIWRRLPELMDVVVEGWAADLATTAAPEPLLVADGQVSTCALLLHAFGLTGNTWQT